MLSFMNKHSWGTVSSREFQHSDLKLGLKSWVLYTTICINAPRICEFWKHLLAYCNMLMANESDYSEVLLRAMYPAWIRPTDMEIITTDQPPDSK